MHYLTDFLSRIVSDDLLLVAIVSALPITEIKSGILLALSLDLDPRVFLPVCFFSSVAPIPAILLIFDVLKKKKDKGKNSNPIFKRIKEKADSMGRNDAFSIFLFVSLPLPLTGVWTGTALASVMNVKPLKAFFAVFSGNVVALTIALTIGNLFVDQAEIIFLALNIISVIGVSIDLVKGSINRKKRKNDRNTTACKRDF